MLEGWLFIMFALSCNIQPFYLSCWTCLDKFTGSIYHVCLVLQYSAALFIMFASSCNIQPLYLSCLPRLAIFNRSIYHVCLVLQYSAALFIKSSVISIKKPPVFTQDWGFLYYISISSISS